MNTTAHIGDALSRIDGPAKVTGQARYAAEHPAPDLLYGWVVSSAVTKGRVASIDAAATRAVPGVVEVVTHENRPHLPWLDRSYTDEVAVPGSPFRALYDDKIAFSMQPLAVVLAESLEAAREGAALLRIVCETEPHNTDLDSAMPEKYEPKKQRSTFEPPKPRGDAAAAYAGAVHRHSAVYTMPVHHHNPMEMHATTVVWEDDDRITVYDKTQGSQNVQGYLVSVFGFSKKDVRVMNPYVGGAFGSGLRPQYQVYLATLAAKMMKRSVRVVLTREQMFSHVHRPPAIQTVSLATDEHGKLLAIVNDATTATSRFEDYMEVVCNWGLMNYACENATGEYTLAKLDTYTPGDMRAPGAATGMTLFEIAVDEMAIQAGVDPLEFRRINYSEREAMGDRPFTSKALKEAYAIGAERFGWSRRAAGPRAVREGGELVGCGVATGMWDAMFMKSAASVKLAASGRMTVSSSVSDIGTGTYTLMAQVAADTLGLPLDVVDVQLGDSALSEAPVQGGSWTAASTGAAVQLAAKAVADQWFAAAKKVEGKPLGDVSREDVAFLDGHVVVRAEPSRRVDLATALQAAGHEAFEAEETAKPGIGDKISAKLKARNTHSAIFAEVRVDEELRVVRVTRIVIAVAAGLIVNPKAARSQILGGVVMGIGMALHEETLTDHRVGRFMNHSLSEYHVATNADIHDIDVIFVDEPDAEVTPLGVKGLGEIGIVGTAAAVVNAIYNATGVRVRSLPATIDKLL